MEKNLFIGVLLIACMTLGYFWKTELDDKKIYRQNIDELKIELRGCKGIKDSLGITIKELKKDFSDQIGKMKEEFIIITSIFTRIHYNQSNIDKTLSKIVSNNSNDSLVIPKKELDNALELINAYQETIKKDLSEAALIYTRIEKGRGQLINEEEEDLLKVLQAQLDTKKEEYKERVAKIIELETTVKNMELKLNEDTLALKKLLFIANENAIKTKKELADKVIEYDVLKADFIKKEDDFLDRIDTLNTKNELLKDTIKKRELEILTLKKSIKNSSKVHFVVGNKGKLKELNLIRGGNAKKLECDYKENAVISGELKPIYKFEQSEIEVFEGNIKRIYPNRPDGSYSLERNRINILKEEQFWSVSEVLVILVND